jgi:hypothetical protein
MNIVDIISEIERDYAEWIEMSEDPHKFIMGILANKVIKLENHVQYLERRLKYVSML